MRLFICFYYLNLYQTRKLQFYVYIFYRDKNDLIIITIIIIIPDIIHDVKWRYVYDLFLSQIGNHAADLKAKSVCERICFQCDERMNIKILIICTIRFQNHSFEITIRYIHSK